MGKPEQFPSETIKPAISKEELVRRVSAVLPAVSLLYDEEDLKPFECDGLSAYRKIPLAVALPETEDQIRAVLKICHEGRVPVVFRGAGTGLSGGALPYEHGLLLGLSKLKRILDIDPEARMARVQPGVRNAAISEAVAQVACTA
jgi:glycolate oxidase